MSSSLFIPLFCCAPKVKITGAAEALCFGPFAWASLENNVIGLFQIELLLLNSNNNYRVKPKT